MMIDHNLKPLGPSKKNNLFVVDEEMMEEIDFPSKCVSDYNYIEGRSETPSYLQPKPPGYIFNCPTIITSNPEELANDELYRNQSLDSTAYSVQSNQKKNSQTEVSAVPDEAYTEEASVESVQLHPYENINRGPTVPVVPSEPMQQQQMHKSQIVEHEPVRSKKYEKSETVARKPHSGKRDHSDRRRNEQNHFDVSVSFMTVRTVFLIS